jgi:hypothetical protein
MRFHHHIWKPVWRAFSSILTVCVSLIIATCLIVSQLYAAPSTFPKGLTIYNSNKTCAGLTLYCANGVDKIFVLDMEGNEIHTWDVPGLGNLVKPLSNGHVLTNVGQKAIWEMDWEGNLVWQFTIPPRFAVIHHDFQRLANGNTIIIVARKRVVPSITPKEIRDDVIIEITPGGEIVWEWSTADHYEALPLSRQAMEIILRGEAPKDLFHTNSVQVLSENQYETTDTRFKAGNLLVSQRETNIVYIIEKSSGNIVWTLDAKTIGQHHVRMIPNSLPGAGDILLFSNGGRAGYPRVWSLFSKVMEFEPTKSKQQWSYNASLFDGSPLGSLFSIYRSSAQRLSNGNTLIAESQWGRIFEVTPDAEIVWEYVVPYYRMYLGENTNQIYRAYRVDLSWPDGPIDLFQW